MANKTRQQRVEELQQMMDANEVAIEPARQELQKAQDKFREECEKLEKPFNNKMQEFLDSVLLDVNGNPVKTGHILTRKGKSYSVTERGCQIIFGKVMNNPQVMVKLRIDKGDIIVWGTRPKSLYVSDLKEYEIFELPGKEAANGKD
jgi:hypothetical protein